MRVVSAIGTEWKKVVSSGESYGSSRIHILECGDVIFSSIEKGYLIGELVDCHICRIRNELSELQENKNLINVKRQL